MISSRTITVDRSEERTAEALREADAFIKAEGLSGKDAIHVRLLAEETLGMVRAMTGDFTGTFRLEHDGGKWQVRLSAETIMNKRKKEELLSVSTSGENAAAKGFMGKISEIFENGLLNYDDAMNYQQQYCGGTVDYGYMGLNIHDGVNEYIWSLQNYKNALLDSEGDAEPVLAARDELEKSIVASLADDVTVGVKGDTVELTITMTTGTKKA